MTGTDEHGYKVAREAEKVYKSREKNTIQKYVDEMALKYQKTFQNFNIDYDMFIRTTSKEHEMAVHEMWKRLDKKELIYMSKYEGYYSVPDESFLTSVNLRSSKC